MRRQICLFGLSGLIITAAALAQGTGALPYTITAEEDTGYREYSRMTYRVILDVDRIPERDRIRSTADAVWSEAGTAWDDLIIYLYLPGMDTELVAYAESEYTPSGWKAFRIHHSSISGTRWDAETGEVEHPVSGSSPYSSVAIASQQSWQLGTSGGILTAFVESPITGLSVGVNCSGSNLVVIFAFSRKVFPDLKSIDIAIDGDLKSYQGGAPDPMNPEMFALVVSPKSNLVRLIRSGNLMNVLTYYADGDIGGLPVRMQGAVTLRGSSKALSQLPCFP